MADMVSRALLAHWKNVTDGATDGVALAAIGSTGRQDAGPCSDLDLVLIHDGNTRSEQELAELSQALWYPIWDAKLELDHATRSVAECKQVAGQELAVASGFLSLRGIAGDSSLTEHVRAWALADWRGSAKHRLPALLADAKDRASRFGELAHLTEPNIKEARGGLRDATSLHALAATWLTDRPHGAIDGAIDHLLDVRDLLHMVAKKGVTTLGRHLVDDVAALAGVPTAEHLLRDLAASAREVAYATDTTALAATRALARTRTGTRGFRARRERAAPKFDALATGLIEADGQIALAANAKPASDPVLPLRAAATAAATGLAIPPAVVVSLGRCPELPVPWPAQAREHLLALLGACDNLASVWEAMDLGGQVVTWLPEWERVRNQPQWNPVHVYTVDRHSVEATVLAGRLAARSEDRQLLLLSALFHDIGKGSGMDHSVAGAALIPELAQRIGLEDGLAMDVETLVRHHLLLPDLATKEDVADPATVATLLGALGGRRDLLESLRVLVEADARAAGPKAWTPWRENLIDSLMSAARATLNAQDA